MTTYRSDVDPDFACLERYLAAGRLGKLNDAFFHQSEHDLKQLIEFIEETAKEMPWASDEAERIVQSLSAKVDLPTRYDSPSQYMILEALVKRVRKAADALQLKAENFPHYACIPTGRVNASAVSLPCSTRPFLLFDSQLFLYCHLFAKAFAGCLPIIGTGGATSFTTDIKRVSERIDTVPAIVERLNDLLYAYVVTGSPHRSRPYQPDRDYIPLIDVLRDGMELFVVAHEFGHVYSGHLGNVLQQLQIASGASVSENKEHRQEHEADIVGLILTLKAMQDSGYDAALAYIGIELFFISMEMADRSDHMFKSGRDDLYNDSASASHPSNSSRRSILNTALELFIESKEQLEGARSMAARYADISKILWERARAANASFRPATPD